MTFSVRSGMLMRNDTTRVNFPIQIEPIAAGDPGRTAALPLKRGRATSALTAASSDCRSDRPTAVRGRQPATRSLPPGDLLRPGADRFRAARVLADNFISQCGKEAALPGGPRRRS